jgi:5-methylthioadenosine/S-adenosylhomocysteine deaminase
MCDDCNEMGGGNNTTAIGRRSLLKGGVLGLVGAAVAAPVVAQSETAPADVPPPSGEYVIDNVGIVTVDAALGTLQKGAIHVRDGKIVAVAETIEAPGIARVDGNGKIAMPGMVDTHWHMWNSLFKNIITPEWGYSHLKNALGPHHTADDYYVATRLVLAEAIDAGITTVLNYAHNVRSPEHANGEIRAMLESGLRGQYAYGGFDPTPLDQNIDQADFKRIRDEFFSHDGHDATGRMALGLAGRAVPAPMDVDRRLEDYQMAFEMGLPIIVHSGQSPAFITSPEQLEAAGVLNERNIFVHGVLLTETDRKLILEKGASVSISFGSEFRNLRGGLVREQALILLHAGGNLTLSCDATSLNPTSLFEQMRLAFALVAPEIGNATAELPAVTAGQCLEMGTINGARAMGLGQVSGSISPGKQADIVLLSTDTLNMSPGSELLDRVIVHSAMRHNVDTVIVDGEVLKWQGKIIAFDAEQVRQDAIAALHDIRVRAGGEYAPSVDSPSHF